MTAHDLSLTPNVFLMSNSFETGGSERQFAALATSLNPRAFGIHLGCIAKRGKFLHGLGHVEEFPLEGNVYGIESLRTRLRLARHLRDRRVSVAHAFDFYTNLTLIPAARMARTPVIVGSQRQLGDLLSAAKSRAQLMMLRWCDAVICNSRAAAERLASDGVRQQRIVVIHNGLPPSSFAPAIPALPRRPGLLRVGMIARMNAASKNHRLFLRAAARLGGKFPRLEFLLVGDGPLRPELEREAIDCGIRDRVHFLGDCKDIPEILASMDVSVLPSASESLSNAVIESMAAGVPVVASDVGGNSELLARNRGVLVQAGDEQSLAVEVERLLADRSARAEIGRNAKEFAERCFTLAEMQRRHEELYTSLLAKKVRPARRFSFPRWNEAGRLRVAIVAPSPRYVGGQSVQADLLLSILRDDPAIEATLIPIDPDFPPFLRWAKNVPFLRTIVREPIYLWRLWCGLRRADIAHIFSASYWSFLLAPTPALVIARIFGAKTLIHYHSGEARDHLTRFRSARIVLKRAGKLVVPSGFLLGVFAEFGIHAEVVPNIVDLSQFSFRARDPIRPHLLCNRGFHPYYCVEDVIRAFLEIKRAFPEARLDLAGGGPLEDQMRALVQELKLDGVIFHGVLSHKEIPKLYDQADIFVNASRLDNMPVSILEAFASGTPVVTTAPEGMRFLVEQGRTGLLSDPGDVSALARNVISLLQDPELSSRLARNAREECRRYSWPEVRGQWLCAYGALTAPVCETHLSIESS